MISQGRTALAWSCRRGEIQYTAKLLELGADPNLGDGGLDGSPPLHLAIRGGHYPCVSILLDHGADIFEADSLSKMKHILLILVASCAVEEVDSLYLSCLDRLLKAGLDINACDVQNMNALIWSVWADNFHFAEWVLARGGNYLQVNYVNYTLLHLAALRASVKTLQVLSKHSLAGLRLDAELDDGTTPLDVVERRTNVSSEWIAAWEDLVQSIIAADLARASKADVGVMVEEFSNAGTNGVVLNEGGEELTKNDGNASEEDDELTDFHDANEYIDGL